MAQIVFVHGVNTRRKDGDSTYDDDVKNHDRRFKELAFKGAAAAIIEEATAGGDAKLIEEREKFWAAAASYVIALKGNKPPWLTPGLNDDDFLAELERQVGASVGGRSRSAVRCATPATSSQAGSRVS